MRTNYTHSLWPFGRAFALDLESLNTFNEPAKPLSPELRRDGNGQPFPDRDGRAGLP